MAEDTESVSGEDQDRQGGISPPGSDPGRPRRRRSRVVLWTSVTVAVVLAAFIAVLASSKQASDTTAESPLIGKSAPAVSGSVINLSGNAQLSQYLGKWVLLNFSASWCAPCVSETPQLALFQQQHSAGATATILGIEYDPGDKSALTSFLKSKKATWPVVDDPQADVSYGVHQLPESFLVNPQGTVVALYLGEVSASGIDKVITEVSSET